MSGRSRRFGSIGVMAVLGAVLVVLSLTVFAVRTQGEDAGAPQTPGETLKLAQTYSYPIYPQARQNQKYRKQRVVKKCKSPWSYSAGLRRCICVKKGYGQSEGRCIKVTQMCLKNAKWSAAAGKCVCQKGFAKKAGQCVESKTSILTNTPAPGARCSQGYTEQAGRCILADGPDQPLRRAARPGETSSNYVTMVQRCLKEAGYLRAPVSSAMGNKAWTAFWFFKQDHSVGRTPQGIRDARAQQKLFALCPKTSSKLAWLPVAPSPSQSTVAVPQRPIRSLRAPVNKKPAPVNKKPAPVKIKRAPVNKKRAPVKIKPVPADIQPALVDIKSALMDLKSALADIQPVPADIPLVPLDIKPALVEIKSALIDIKSALADIKSAPVDIKPALKVLKSALVDIKSPPGDIQPALMDIKSALMDLKSTLANMKSAPANIKPAPEVITPVNRVYARPEAGCLPKDLYNLITGTYGPRPGLKICTRICLPMPASITQQEIEDYQTNRGIRWCRACIELSAPLPLDDILRLERGANVQLCTRPPSRLPQWTRPAASSRKAYTRVRALYTLFPPATDHGKDIAVVIGNATYRDALPFNASARASAGALYATLTEHLGYRQENIIDVRDAPLEQLIRIFGSGEDHKGDLWRRVNKQSGARVLIYYAGHAGMRADQSDSYLLPVDAVKYREERTSYPMSRLYANLEKLEAESVLLLLEAGFGQDLDEFVYAPNLPGQQASALPARPQPRLTVISASDRDQKTLDDPGYGIGLFTRYLIEGLAGRADLEPIGNRDGEIDAIELYAYTSHMVRLAARKSYGLLQNPMFSNTGNGRITRVQAQTQ